MGRHRPHSSVVHRGGGERFTFRLGPPSPIRQTRSRCGARLNGRALKRRARCVCRRVGTYGGRRNNSVEATARLRTPRRRRLQYCGGSYRLRDRGESKTRAWPKRVARSDALGGPQKLNLFCSSNVFCKPAFRAEKQVAKRRQSAFAGRTSSRPAPAPVLRGRLVRRRVRGEWALAGDEGPVPNEKETAPGRFGLRCPGTPPPRIR